MLGDPPCLTIGEETEMSQPAAQQVLGRHSPRRGVVGTDSGRLLRSIAQQLDHRSARGPQLLGHFGRRTAGKNAIAPPAGFTRAKSIFQTPRFEIERPRSLLADVSADAFQDPPPVRLGRLDQQQDPWYSRD